MTLLSRAQRAVLIEQRTAAGEKPGASHVSSCLSSVRVKIAAFLLDLQDLNESPYVDRLGLERIRKVFEERDLAVHPSTPVVDGAPMPDFTVVETKPSTPAA